MITRRRAWTGAHARYCSSWSPEWHCLFCCVSVAFFVSYNWWWDANRKLGFWSRVAAHFIHQILLLQILRFRWVKRMFNSLLLGHEKLDCLCNWVGKPSYQKSFLGTIWKKYKRKKNYRRWVNWFGVWLIVSRFFFFLIFNGTKNNFLTILLYRYFQTMQFHLVWTNSNTFVIICTEF